MLLYVGWSIQCTESGPLSAPGTTVVLVALQKPKGMAPTDIFPYNVTLKIPFKGHMSSILRYIELLTIPYPSRLRKQNANNSRAATTFRKNSSDIHSFLRNHLPNSKIKLPTVQAIEEWKLLIFYICHL